MSENPHSDGSEFYADNRYPAEHWLLIMPDPAGGWGGPPYPQEVEAGTPGAKRYVSVDRIVEALREEAEKHIGADDGLYEAFRAFADALENPDANPPDSGVD